MPRLVLAFQLIQTFCANVIVTKSYCKLLLERFISVWIEAKKKKKKKKKKKTSIIEKLKCIHLSCVQMCVYCI